MKTRSGLFFLSLLAVLGLGAGGYKLWQSHRPYVMKITPEKSAQKVNEHVAIATRQLILPNGNIDKSTINEATVYLAEAGSGQLVPARVLCDAEGDTIELLPVHPLKLNTTYQFNITNGVKDLKGYPLIPYTATFTTGLAPAGELGSVQFSHIQLPYTEGQHSSLTFGPDGKLYALGADGVIKRFTVATDGTLSVPEMLYGLQDAYGHRTPRLAIGLTFDPSATADNPVAWITHSTYMLEHGPDWDGKLSRLSGPKLQKVEDVLVNLPRSAKDHLTNSIAFGPDGALYFAQGSTTAMGAPDPTWQMREEHLLSGAILRLDTKALSRLPLDVRTPDGGGRYNPYAAGAPLTLYATGFRNAYDLLWHSNGNLYVPTNGSSVGGNIPEAKAGTKAWDGTIYKGPEAPSRTNVRQTQKDFLFRGVKGGYYGHPNPVRGEFVMNGGNPTENEDPAEITSYPVGTLPDPNWRGFAFDFQNHKSPNGVIEYKGNAFGGALKGKLIVARYTTGDLIILTPGGKNGDIVSFTEGNAIAGFSGFILPLDLVEDPTTGFIYVSEYGTGGITLLRPGIEKQKVHPSSLLFANRN